MEQENNLLDLHLASWAMTAHFWVIVFHLSVPSSLSLRDALNPLITQLVSMFVIAPAHVQDLALGPLEYPEICTGSPQKPVQVPLDVTSLQHVDHSQKFGVSRKTEGALNFTLDQQDVKQGWCPSMNP